MCIRLLNYWKSKKNWNNDNLVVNAVLQRKPGRTVYHNLAATRNAAINKVDTGGWKN